MVAHVGHLWQMLCVRFSPSGVTEGKKNKCLFDVADKSVTVNKDCVCFVLYLNKEKKIKCVYLERKIQTITAIISS